MTKSLVPQGLLFFVPFLSCLIIPKADQVQRHNTQKAGSLSVLRWVSEKLGGGIIWREWGQNSLSLWEGAGPGALWSGFEGRRVRGGLRGESWVRATARGRTGNSERCGDSEGSNDPAWSEAGQGLSASGVRVAARRPKGDKGLRSTSIYL